MAMAMMVTRKKVNILLSCAVVIHNLHAYGSVVLIMDIHPSFFILFR